MLDREEQSWTKLLTPKAGSGGGWRDDLPLDDGLPEHVVIDASALQEARSMFLMRLHVFAAWHRSRGRRVTITEPNDRALRRRFEELHVGIDGEGSTVSTDMAGVVPLTHVDGFSLVEEIASRARELIAYEVADVSHLGSACHMAVSELCGNAVEHGRNSLGAFVAVERLVEPRPHLVVTISDLGLGIPEHLRQRYPEWNDDGYAIAHALQQGITGTGDRQRGNGFSETFHEALVGGQHSAQLEIHSANGFVKSQLVDGRVHTNVSPPPRFRRGTWISFTLISV